MLVHLPPRSRLGQSRQEGAQAAAAAGEGGTLDDVANAVMEHRVYLHVFAPDLPGYASLSEIDRAEFQPICGPLEDPQAAMRRLVSNTSNFHATLEMLARSVSRSAAVEVL